MKDHNGGMHEEYFIKDHLGNVRVRFEDSNEDGEIQYEFPVDNEYEESELIASHHYYSRRDFGDSTEEPVARPNPAVQRGPFGMEWKGHFYANPDTEVQRKRYNGKEYEEGLGLLDYGARWYDPVVASWDVVDPLAAAYPQFSTYAYVGNMPIRYIDPDGRRLFLAGSNLKKEIQDILSLVNDADFEGEVTINFEDSDKAAKEVKVDFGSADVKSSAGLSLLSDVTSSSKNYLYEVSGVASGLEREQFNLGKAVNLDYPLAQGAKALNKVATNFSITSRGDKEKYAGTYFNFKKFDAVPKNGFDGHVIVSPNTSYMQQETASGWVKANRAGLIFHELRENYLRTEKGKSYSEAHSQTKEDEKSFYAYPANGIHNYRKKQ